jgi:hypothetical protein
LEEVKMKKVKSASPARADIVKLDATVDKADLVAIRVAEFEKQLMVSEQKSKAEISRLEAENKSLVEEVKKDVQADATRDLKANADKVAAGVAVLTGRAADVEIRSSTPAGVNKDGPTLYHAEVFIGDKRSHGFVVNVEREVSVAVKSKLEKIEANSNAADKETENIIAVRGNLSKIATVERMARGELAKMKLRSEGQDELLANMLAIDLPGFPALPAPTK